MDNSDTYKTIRSVSEGLFKDKGSRFISFAIPVSDENEVKNHIERIRKEYHDARHHCFAYIIGRDQAVWRANDDGEPSGTAGRPILGQIRAAGLTNVMVVVIRYFGGTLLGVSGLINAYKNAAADAIGKSEIYDHIMNVHYRISFPYPAMNDVMRIIKDEEAGQSDQNFGLDCSLVIFFRASVKEKILERLSRIEGIKITFLEEK